MELPWNYTPSKEATTIATLDATATIGWSHYEIGFTGQNLVGQQYRLGEYNFVSDFHTQGAATLVPVRHFTAGAPRAW